MPITDKGEKIKKAMRAFYKKKTGSAEKGENIFYASANKGIIRGVHGSGPFSKSDVARGYKKLE